MHVHTFSVVGHALHGVCFFASYSFVASFSHPLESTNSTGCAISLLSDFLGDTRFGFCYGIFLADRNRCCGGSENVDFLLETCLRAKRIGSVPVKDLQLSDFSRGSPTYSSLGHPLRL